MTNAVVPTRAGLVRPKLDQICADAVDIARDAVIEDIAGPYIEAISEGERLVTHYFECTMAGYRGWRWAVTVARTSRSKQVTICETVLLPGPDALTTPEWVPWNERVQPGDLGVGDLMPTSADDDRLVPGYLLSEDPAVDDVVWELGLGRVRVMSREGRLDAAERWYEGEHGPQAPIAVAAPANARCVSCGFFLPLAGSMSALFGACANLYAPDDGRVVSGDHGCGAHSEVLVEQTVEVDEAPTIYDDAEVEPVAVPVATETVAEAFAPVETDGATAPEAVEPVARVEALAPGETPVADALVVEEVVDEEVVVEEVEPAGEAFTPVETDDVAISAAADVLAPVEVDDVDAPETAHAGPFTEVSEPAEISEPAEVSVPAEVSEPAEVSVPVEVSEPAEVSLRVEADEADVPELQEEPFAEVYLPVEAEPGAAPDVRVDPFVETYASITDADVEVPEVQPEPFAEAYFPVEADHVEVPEVEVEPFVEVSEVEVEPFVEAYASVETDVAAPEMRAEPFAEVDFPAEADHVDVPEVQTEAFVEPGDADVPGPEEADPFVQALAPVETDEPDAVVAEEIEAPPTVDELESVVEAFVPAETEDDDAPRTEATVEPDTAMTDPTVDELQAVVETFAPAEAGVAETGVAEVGVAEADVAEADVAGTDVADAPEAVEVVGWVEADDMGAPEAFGAEEIEPASFDLREYAVEPAEPSAFDLGSEIPTTDAEDATETLAATETFEQLAAVEQQVEHVQPEFAPSDTDDEAPAFDVGSDVATDESPQHP